MIPADAGKLLAVLAQIPDPPGGQGRRHPLAAMLAAVVCATLCGARGYSAIVQWLHVLPVAWWHRLGFTRRPPKDRAFRDQLAALSPEALEAALRSWTTTLLGESIGAEQLRAIALDGKTLASLTARSARLVKIHDGPPPVLVNVAFSADRREYNTTGQIHFVYTREGPPSPMATRRP